jgi:hypothetical protein
MGDFKRRVGNAEVIDPIHFRKQADDLAEGVGDAEQKYQTYEAVEAGVVHEGRSDGGKEHRHQNGDHQDEHHHADQIDPRQVDRHLLRVVRHCRNQHASTLSHHLTAKTLEGKDVAKRCHWKKAAAFALWPAPARPLDEEDLEGSPYMALWMRTSASNMRDLISNCLIKRLL